MPIFIVEDKDLHVIPHRHVAELEDSFDGDGITLCRASANEIT